MPYSLVSLRIEVFPKLVLMYCIEQPHVLYAPIFIVVYCIKPTYILPLHLLWQYDRHNNWLGCVSHTYLHSHKHVHSHINTIAKLYEDILRF
jgi:hypothetical protein